MLTSGIEEVREFLPHAHVIEGDATHDHVLLEAGLLEAKGLITCLSKDTDNLFVCLSARDLAAKVKIVARAYEEATMDKLYRAGADRAMRAAGDRWKLVQDGGARRWVRRASPPFPILIYHRVNPWPSSFAIDVTPPDRFRRQMEHLARRYRVLPLEELWRRTQEGSLPPRCVAVTFDDGYADNHEFALPILRELGIPATVFVVTGCIGTGVIPWHDRVLAAFERTLLLTPEYAMAHYHMGVVLGRLGRFEEARQRLEEYLEYHPWDAPTKYHLGMLCARFGEVDAAKRYLAGLPEFKAGIPTFPD